MSPTATKYADATGTPTFNPAIHRRHHTSQHRLNLALYTSLIPSFRRASSFSATSVPFRVRRGGAFGDRAAFGSYAVARARAFVSASGIHPSSMACDVGTEWVERLGSGE